MLIKNTAVPSAKNITASLIPALLTGILAGFLAMTAFFGLEISDEGLYLYQFVHGGEAPFMSHFHLLLHPLGQLFNHHLIIYRFLGQTLLLASAWWFASQSLHFLDEERQLHPASRMWIRALILMGAFLAGAFTLTPGYQLISTLGGYLWTGSIFLLISSPNKNKKALILLGFSCFVAGAGRAPFGLALSVLSMLLIPRIILQKKLPLFENYSIFFISLFFFIALILFLDFEGVTKTLNVINHFRLDKSSTHAQLRLLRTFEMDFINLTKHRTVHVILLAGMLSVFIKRTKFARLAAPFFLSLISFLAIRHFDIRWEALTARLGVFSLSIVPFAVLLSPGTSRGSSWKKRAFFASYLSVAISYLSSSGTNSDMIHKMAFSMAHGGLLFAILSWPDKRRVSLIQLAYAFLFFTWVSISLYQGRAASPARSQPITSMSLYHGPLQRLQGLFMEKGIPKTLNRLNTTLENIHFDRNQDRLIGHEGLAGVLYAIEAKTFGPSWYSYKFRNNLPYLKIQSVKGIRNIWILQFEEIETKTMKYLSQRIPSMTLPAQQKISIGFINHRSGRRQLSLKGPYPVPHNAQQSLAQP